MGRNLCRVKPVAQPDREPAARLPAHITYTTQIMILSYLGEFLYEMLSREERAGQTIILRPNTST